MGHFGLIAWSAPLAKWPQKPSCDGEGLRRGKRRGKRDGSVSSLWYNKPMFRNCAALSIFAEHLFPFLGLFRKNNRFRVAAEKHCKNNICSKSSANETPEK